MSVLFSPTCNRNDWKKRQKLLKKVRTFFEERSILEVETPSLSRACGTDPHLDFIETLESPPRYLMTSPEFHMKRLLAAGFGDVYQITKSFRHGETGDKHNSEFSIVEWYRENWDLEKLMQETEALCSLVLEKPIKAKRTRWIDAFKNYAGVDPFCQNQSCFIETCQKHQVPIPEYHKAFSREDWWDYLMVMVIEAFLGKEQPEFLTDYPPSQAALAQIHIDQEGYSWGKRFELYIHNIELCNGYQELTDPIEQKNRFQKDIQTRQNLEKPIPAIDQNFLDALHHGLPYCSGVALGLDRLFMLALHKKQISSVLLFPDDRA
ncbi:MAG: EF-P lysine aminoacylase GenX [Fibrobacter sp.]|jgi:lysyl-tRNA synthetase class 2|nr:EF-P lysine aminoacylase GenX [Fibrobacter sp.]